MPQYDDWFSTAPDQRNQYMLRPPPRITHRLSNKSKAPAQAQASSSSNDIMAKMQAMIDALTASMSQAFDMRMTQPEYTFDTGPTADELTRQHFQQQIDQLLTQRNAAWSQAGDTLNTQLESEQSRAALYGMDLPPVTDELRQTRQQDLFAGYWNAGQEAELQALINNYGSPEQSSMFAKFRRGKSPDKLREAADKSKLALLGGSDTSALLADPTETLG